MTPQPAAAPRYAVDVRSIGRAGPEVHRALKRVMDMPHQQIVARLYQAPSELLRDLEHDTAQQIAALLGSTGLDVRVRDDAELMEPGAAEFDVALHLLDPGKLPAVAAEVSRFLGCELPKAAQLLWASPAMLVGQVSQATVDALRARFEPLGAEVDVSRPGQALYDVFIGECAPSVRRRAEDVLRREGVGEVNIEGPLLALGVTRPQVERFWRRLESTHVPLTVLNRDLQRYDLRLDVAEDSPALRQLIVEATGMPESLAPKVLKKLPLNLFSGVRHATLGPRMQAFAEVGATLSAHLLSFRTFDLVIERSADPQATAELLAATAGGSVTRWRGALMHPPLRLEGPFPHTRALWMRQELIQRGAKLRLIER